ncbi:MAG: hypothetical protein ACRDZ4_04725 [Egibacteraceae bacterium]
MPQVYVERRQSLPSGGADGTQVQLRGTKYGEAAVQVFGPVLYPLANEGQYFSAMTVTPGTAYTLTAAAQNAFSATQALWVLRNTDAEGAKRVFVDHARIVFATAGTAGTRVEVAIAIDNINRYSSGGTAQTIANVNMDSATATVAAINAGAVTAAAVSGAVRYIYRGTLSTAIPAVGETHYLDFGGKIHSTHVNKTLCVGPVVLGGGDSLVVHLWLPSQSAAPTGELQMAWWER